MNLSDTIARFETDVELAHDIVHGGVADTVTTEGGILRTFAKALADLQLAINAFTSSPVTPVLNMLVDGSLGPATVTLPASGIRRLIRIDDAGGVATITPSVVGHTVMGGSAYAWDSPQRDFIVLELIGTDWYRIG
jgi:hypothetical protein